MRRAMLLPWQFTPDGHLAVFARRPAILFPYIRTAHPGDDVRRKRVWGCCDTSVTAGVHEDAPRGTAAPASFAERGTYGEGYGTYTESSRPAGRHPGVVRRPRRPGRREAGQSAWLEHGPGARPGHGHHHGVPWRTDQLRGGRVHRDPLLGRLNRPSTKRRPRHPSGPSPCAERSCVPSPQVRGRSSRLSPGGTGPCCSGRHGPCAADGVSPPG